MKTLGVLLLLISTALCADQPIARTSIDQILGAHNNASGGGTLIKIVQLGTGEPRQFDVFVKTVISDGAVASGTFLEDGKRIQAGSFFVHGIPAGTIDGMRLSLWLEREGVKTYQRGEEKTSTVASYRVIPTPPAPVTIPRRTDPLKSFGGTALDQRPSR